MSLEDVARRTVEGMAGKLLLSASVTVIIGISSWTLHSIADHSAQLSGISQKIDDLSTTVTFRANAMDVAISKLSADDQEHTIAIARAEEAIEDLRRSPRAASQPIPQIPVIGDALSHIFPAIPPHSHRRTRGH